MTELSYTITGTSELKRNLQRFGEFALRKIGAALYQESEKIMAESKDLVPVYLGILRSSGRVEFPVYSSDGVEITLGYGGAASGYALYIHEGTGPAVGRRAFMPPVAPFKEWAKRVLGDESLGFVIARSVGRKGLKPRKFLSTPLLAAVSGMDRRLADNVSRELESFT